MFSKKIVIIVGIIVLIAVNLIALSVTSRHYHTSRSWQIAISVIAPFQQVTTRSIFFIRDIWSNYFCLVGVKQENDKLKKSLSRAIEKNNQFNEIESFNLRVRKLLKFRKNMTGQVLVAEVIGKDPSPLFKTIIIDKGKSDGVEKGSPVLAPEGIAGQVIDVSLHSSKVLLIVDQISAIDALVQRTRARGIVKGGSTGQCFFLYALRKHDIRVGDTIVSSGLDTVFPKGLRIGKVSDVIKRNSGLFQEVIVTPYVDFEKLEEVLIALNAKLISDVSNK
ncbi:MAG: rod shape-determining protein MreC [Thermodesulfobacteriota bacterium]|nr:rod shape-determining protein MreC [Thermodesulfobacteriota bacterium]